MSEGDLDFGPDEVKPLDEQVMFEANKVLAKRGLIDEPPPPSPRVKLGVRYGTETKDYLKDYCGVLEAYQALKIKGGQIPADLKEENNMVRCPDPGHNDLRESAWANTVKNVICCGRCNNEGFDQLDLAAIALGRNWKTYKTNGDEFADVLEAYGTALGLKMERRGNQVGVWQAGELLGIRGVTSTRFDVKGIPGNNGSPLPGEVEEEYVEEVEIEFPALDLDTPVGALFPTGSFMDEWLKYNQAKHPTVAVEYFFATGLSLLGLVAGRSCHLNDPVAPVYANPAIVLIGTSGSRKSVSLGEAKHLINDVMPWDPDRPSQSEGAKMGTPGSGESLIDLMRRQPDANGRIHDVGIKALVEFSEFSWVTKMLDRSGGTLEPVMMAFMDGENRVGTQSRSSGETYAEDAHALFFTTTQPKALPDIIRTANNAGFLNRWLWIGGLGHERPTAFPTDQHSPAAAKSALGAIVGWCERTGRINHSPDDEYAGWVALQVYMRDNHDTTDENEVDPLLQRIEVHAKRLALLLAINERSTTVDARIMEKSLHLIKTYVIPMFTITSDTLTVSHRNAMADELVRAIRHLTETGEPPTWSRMKKYSRQIRKWGDEAHALLDGYLIKSGQVMKYVAEDQVVDRYIALDDD